MKLSASHSFFTTSKDIAEIVKPLQNIGITYFNYLKSEHHGSRVYLQSDATFLENFLEGKYYLTGHCENNPSDYKSEIIHWSTLPNQHILDELVRSRNIDHGIFLFEAHPDYCEFYAFATDKKNDHIINSYFNNMDILKKFPAYFREKASSIIKQAEKIKLFCHLTSKKWISH